MLDLESLTSRDEALRAVMAHLGAGIQTTAGPPGASLGYCDRGAGDTSPGSCLRRVPGRGQRPAVFGAGGTRGIARPYVHQAEAITHALAGRNVVVVTPTASGKTLCYNVPVLSAVIDEPAARSLYLFPTKALAQDQLAELHELADGLRAHGHDVGAYTYDGDTPQDARRAIRRRANVVLSNPEMLHSGILPHHPRWAKLFENLRYIVLDELHAYRGIFGSHLANILRRLRRICCHYGSDPLFICSSATIANLRIPLMWNAESGDLERGFRRSGTLVGAQRRLVSQ